MEQKQFFKRRIYIINRSFQVKYLFIILSMMLISIAVVSFISFYVIWDNVIDEFFFIPEAQKKLADIFVKTSELLVVAVLFLGVIFTAAGVFLSHRVAGPLYRVERVAEELSKGNLDVNVRFRKSDELHTLAESMNKMISGIKGIVVEDKKIIEKLAEVSEKLSADVKKQKGLKKGVIGTIRKLDLIIHKLKKATDKFKT